VDMQATLGHRPRYASPALEPRLAGVWATLAALGSALLAAFGYYRH
jgi:hypothetical protein